MSGNPIVHQTRVTPAQRAEFLIDALGSGLTPSQTAQRLKQDLGIKMTPNAVRCFAHDHRQDIVTKMKLGVAALDTHIYPPMILLQAHESLERAHEETLRLLDERDKGWIAAMGAYTKVLEAFMRSFDRMKAGAGRDNSEGLPGDPFINFEGVNLSADDRQRLAEAVGVITRLQGLMYARREGREIVLSPEGHPPLPMSEAPFLKLHQDKTPGEGGPPPSAPTP